MNWASYILSFCLHVLIILLIWLWPASPPVRLDAPPVMISLVDGAPGGNRTPSSILGAAGQPTSGPRDFAAPAPKAEVAAPAATPPQAEPIKSPPKEAAQDRSPKDEVKEAPRPRPKPDDNAAALLAKKKKEEEAKRRQEERERQQAFLYYHMTELWGHVWRAGAGNGETGASEAGAVLENPYSNPKA